MRKSIEVVDDFYRAPMAVRQAALQRSVWPHDGGEPGHARTYTAVASPEVREQLGRVTGFDPADGGSLEGYFEFIGSAAASRLTPRIGASHWTAVVYLNLPGQCSGGVGFYRLRQAAPQDSAPSLWEETSHIPMQFNRMVLFRSSALAHRPSSGFGEHPESGRLTQVFHFNDIAV